MRKFLTIRIFSLLRHTSYYAAYFNPVLIARPSPKKRLWHSGQYSLSPSLFVASQFPSEIGLGKGMKAIYCIFRS